MPAGKYDFTVEQGSSFITYFAWKGLPSCADMGAPETVPYPINMTGLELKMQVRSSPASTTVLFEATSSNGMLPIVSPEVGQFELRIPPEISSAWAWLRGVYDIEVKNPVTGIVQRILEGAMTVLPEVTR